MSQKNETDGLLHVTNLTMGDWSYDGHNQTSVKTIVSNLSTKQIEEAYKAGTKIVGFDLTKDVARDYEDTELPSEFADMLRKHGFDVDSEIEKHVDEENGFILWIDTFPKIFFFIVKLGNPDFRYAEAEQKQNINIGGYGLFSL